MSDLISRKAAIDAECEACQIAPKKERGHNCTYYVHGCKEIECLRALPTAQPDIIRCKDCKYWHEHKYTKETKSYIPFCGFNAIYTESNDFCSRAERRE